MVRGSIPAKRVRAKGGGEEGEIDMRLKERGSENEIGTE